MSENVNVLCYFGCGREIDPNARGAWRRMVGWEHKSSTLGTRRGGSDISMREPTGEYACEACMTRVKQGLSPQQGALL